ncbi:MAG: DUF192 domain-containing protein [bacterium]|nr:DUF192 domain-containing protein [bacterium]
MAERRTKAMIKIVGIGILLLIIVVGYFVFTKPAHIDEADFLLIGDTTVRIELAKTAEEKTRGLSGREGISEEDGLLFVYDTDDFYYFWMKDMKFPIDIIWLDKDWRVVYIADNVLPETYPNTFVSKEPARYVLEVASGFSARHGISVGTQSEFVTSNQ